MYAQQSTPGASLRLPWEGTVATRHPALGASAHDALGNGVPVWVLMAAGIALLILGLGALLLLGRRRTSRRAVR